MLGQFAPIILPTYGNRGFVPTGYAARVNLAIHSWSNDCKAVAEDTSIKIQSSPAAKVVGVKSS